MAGILRDPVRVEVTPQVVAVERIDQTVYAVPTPAKKILLVGLLEDPAMSRVVVFTRTKHGANRLADQLARSGIAADAIHGNKSQNARQRALEAFRDGEVRVLVATDIAARGIDVEGVSHVVNYDLPVEPEAYVHRIGRTARAGRGGAAISFCDPAEKDLLRAIEKLTRLSFTLKPVDVDPALIARARAAEPRGPHGAQPKAAVPGDARKPRRGGRPQRGRRAA